MIIFRQLARNLGLVVILTLLFLGQGYWNATRTPMVRVGRVVVQGWPSATPPLHILLISDIHVVGPDMPPSRLAQIVAQINALHPDLVLIAGDFVSQKRLTTHSYSADEIVAPLAALRAPMGTVAVLGNHDHGEGADAFARAFAAANVPLLRNTAIQRGPLVIGGVDDEYSHHDDIAATYRAMDRLWGTRIILTHSPDIVPHLPSPVAAVFTGHTHCGQATLPLLGQVANVSSYGMRFNCGMIDDHGQTVIVGAGVGTSGLWVRYGTPPDMWLVSLGG